MLGSVLVLLALNVLVEAVLGLCAGSGALRIGREGDCLAAGRGGRAVAVGRGASTDASCRNLIVTKSD